MTKRLKVDIVCTGLGRINRGYESFAAECFAALRSDPEVDLALYGARGTSRIGGHNVPCFSRTTLGAWLLGKLFRGDPYFGEQASFLVPYLASVLVRSPDVIFCSDRGLLDLLWELRHRLKFRYRLVASNGGPMGPPFTRTDYAQHLLQQTFQWSAEQGEPLERIELLPYGFDIPPKLATLTTDERIARRISLGLPADRAIVLVVGAVNATQKRVDYLIREIATLPAKPGRARPYLLLLGQREAETDALDGLAVSLLGHDGFGIRTVAASDVGAFYAVCDVFAHGSLREGFGRVLVEASAAGLPCIVHDEENFRFILGTLGHYADLSRDGSLAETISAVLSKVEDADLRRRRHAAAFERFSWQLLRPRYIEMFKKCACLPAVRAVRLRDAVAT